MPRSRSDPDGRGATRLLSLESRTASASLLASLRARRSFRGRERNPESGMSWSDRRRWWCDSRFRLVADQRQPGTLLMGHVWWVLSYTHRPSTIDSPFARGTSTDSSARRAVIIGQLNAWRSTDIRQGSSAKGCRGVSPSSIHQYPARSQNIRKNQGMILLRIPGVPNGKRCEGEGGRERWRAEGSSRTVR